MSKVSIELVHEVLSAENLEPDTIQKVLAQIEEQAAAELEAEKANRDPAVKKQYVVIMWDPQGIIPNDGCGAWIATIPEDECYDLTMEKLIRAAYEYNISKKGRKYPVKTIPEACEVVGARFLKEQGLSIKTKTPVMVVTTDGRIPEIESDF